MNWIVSSQYPYPCCRTIRYTTCWFASTPASTIVDSGVVVRLSPNTVDGACASGAILDVTIANNTDDDIFVPFSNDLDGDRLKLYPFRILYENGRPVRLARQLQYNDMVERTDALLRFHRIPAGREANLHAVIEQRWLCSPTTSVGAEYLAMELNPIFYTDRVRGIRGAEYRRDPGLVSPIGIAYEISYTSMRYLDTLPIIRRVVNEAGDTTSVTVGLKDEIGPMLDVSLRLARSNVVTLRIDD